MSAGTTALVTVVILAVSISLQVVITRWGARQYAKRVRPGWDRVAAGLALQESGGPMGMALRYDGMLDGRPVSVLAWRRMFSKFTTGWRSWRVIIIQVNAQWTCAPRNRKGVVWDLDPLGYQGGKTLSWHGEAMAKDAPEVAPGVLASAPRSDLDADAIALLARRVATGQAWILSNRISLAWTGNADDEGAVLTQAIADARALARLAVGPVA